MTYNRPLHHCLCFITSRPPNSASDLSNWSGPKSRNPRIFSSIGHSPKPRLTSIVPQISYSSNVLISELSYFIFPEVLSWRCRQRWPFTLLKYWWLIATSSNLLPSNAHPHIQPVPSRPTPQFPTHYNVLQFLRLAHLHREISQGFSSHHWQEIFRQEYTTMA